MKILDFLKKENIPYKNLALYKEAFTHASYANESHYVKKDYERLEFMGDAVLQLYVSEFIFKLFPDVPEGTLTTLRSKLVREESLARFARQLDLGQLIYLGVGEEKSGGRDRDSVLANVFESFIGALYLDCGKDEVLKILEQTIYSHVNDLDYDDITDYKTTLQAVATAEIVQNEKFPVYIMLSGGTNSKTAELANMCGINYHGIAIGSYAREIVRKYHHGVFGCIKKDFCGGGFVGMESKFTLKNSSS